MKPLKMLKLRMQKQLLDIDLGWQSIYSTLSKRRQSLGLIGGGLMMGIAPVNAWGLAWIAMIPLWWAVRRSIENQRLQSALLGAVLWGLTYHATALSWSKGIHPVTWLGLTWLQSFLGLVVFWWSFVSVYAMAIAAVWVILLVKLNWLAQKKRAPAQKTARGKGLSIVSHILIGTAGWCAIEWVWSQGPLYWSSLSYTQSPGNLWILHLGQISGPAAVTAAIVAVNGLLAEAWLHRADSRVGGFLRGAAPTFFYSAIALFLGLHLIGWGLYAQPLTDRPNAAVKIGLIQGNIPTNRKLTSQGVQEARQVYLDGYESLAEAGAEIVVTPEGAIPQRWNAFLQSKDLLQRAVIRRGVPLVLGTFVREDIDDNTTPITQSLITPYSRWQSVWTIQKSQASARRRISSF